MIKKLTDSWKNASGKMKGVHILLTYRCIFECDHCFVWSSPDSSATMTISYVRKILDEARVQDREHIF